MTAQPQALAFDIGAAAPITRPACSVAVFQALCEARAYLVAIGEMAVHEAVDSLQAAAENGPLQQIDQDAVQAIMSNAFMRETAVPEFQHPDVPIVGVPTTQRPSHPVARDGVASAAEMQRHYERAISQERRDYGLAPSTVAAFKHVLAQNDLKRLRSWLARRAPEERAELKRSMVAK